MQHRVTLHGRGSASFMCRQDQPVLLAMNASNARVIDIGCRSGGCGVCKVQVLSGDFTTGTMSRAQVSEAEQARGVALACQLYPRGDLVLESLRRAPPPFPLPPSPTFAIRP